MSRATAGAACVTMLLIIATAAQAKEASSRTHPDTADRNTLITLRDGVRTDARQILSRIGSCERGVRDPYGTGRDGFNQCIKPLLERDFYKSRFEPAMLIGVLRDLAPGRCAGLASGLQEAISSLGNEAETWIADAENPDVSAAALESADAHDMRAIARGILTLAAARGWRTACRARPYQPSEHNSRRAALRQAVRSVLLF